MVVRGASSAGLLRWGVWLGFGLGLVATGVLLFRAQSSGPHQGSASSPRPRPRVAEPSPQSSSEAEPRSLSLPTGAAVGIACAEAQRVGAFVRRELAAPAIAPVPVELAELWGGMLDPHGLWSAPSDSPLSEALKQAAPDMLESLSETSGGCAAAERVAQVFEPWLARLAASYDAAFDEARSRAPKSDAEVFTLAAEPIYEDDPVTRPGLELARELGARLGSFVARFPDELALAERARARFLPSGSSVLQGIVTLAALRAYVPLVDPHGDFAPLDEEWALYAGDSTLDAGSPLWGDIARTPLGARIVADPTPPLELDDVVLSINGLSLAGASLDQIEQAARSAPAPGELALRVLRQGEAALLSLAVVEQGEPAEQALDVEHIHYGQEGGSVLRVVVPDVGDWLGQDLADVLANEAPGSSAVLLDLRGNGGGSLDAAVDTLGLFMPGVPLFPLIRRGQVSEVLAAPRPEHPYLGPVAVLVDGDTASAAEMIAGGLQAYGRGVVIGVRTFGKGCVQEYFDDVAPSGVLRLTTLQFVMPNGKPLQQIGLTPDILLSLPPALERESEITRQPITFDGPDVRDQKSEAGPGWPHAKGPPGPCRDLVVCTAISRLALARPMAAGGARAARPRAGMR